MRSLIIPCNGAIDTVWHKSGCSIMSPSRTVMKESACRRKASMQSAQDKLPVMATSILASCSACSQQQQKFQVRVLMVRREGDTRLLLVFLDFVWHFYVRSGNLISSSARWLVEESKQFWRLGLEEFLLHLSRHSMRLKHTATPSPCYGQLTSMELVALGTI